MADRCHVRPYLVGASGKQVDLNKGQVVFRGKHAVSCFNGKCISLSGGFQVYLIFTFVLLKEALKCGFLFSRSAVNNGKVLLVDLTFFNFFVKNSKGFCIFCRNYNTSRTSINSVGKGRGKAVFCLGTVFSLIIKVVLNSAYKGVAVFLVIGMN